MKRLWQDALAGSLWMAFGTYSGFIINFATAAVVARLIGPEHFGAYAVAAAAAEIIFLPSAMSFGQALVQAPKADHGLAETVVAMSSILAGLLCAIGIAAAILLSGRLGREVATAIAVLAVARALGIVVGAQSAALEGRFAYRVLAVLRLLTNACTSAAVLGLAWLAPGIGPLVARDALPIAFSGIVFLVGSRGLSLPTGRWIDFSLARRVLRVGSGWFLVRGTEMLFHRLDQLLLAPRLTSLGLGLYSQARYVSMLPNAMVAPATLQVALRTYGALSANINEQARLYVFTRYWLLRIMIPCAVPILLFPEGVLWLLFGSRWIQAAPYLAAFGPMMVFLPLFESSKTLLLARHLYFRVAAVYLVEILLVGIALLLLGRGPSAGVVGALANSVAVVAASFATERIALSEPERTTGDWLAPLLGAGAALIYGVGLKMVMGIPGNPPCSLVAAATSGATATAVMIGVDRNRLKEMVRILRRHRASEMYPTHNRTSE